MWKILLVDITIILIVFGLVLLFFQYDNTTLSDQQNQVQNERKLRTIEKFSADYQQSPVTGQCKYQADTGLVCPMKLHQEFSDHILHVGTYLDASIGIKLQCCRYLLKEWGQENNVVSVAQQDDFIKHHWSNSDALYVLTQNYTDSDEKFIGCVAIDRKNFYPYLSHLYVIPEDRKRGMGKFLLKFVENYTSKNGFSEIRLWCNPDLFLYYSRLGYREESRENGLVFMTKKLKKLTI